MSGLTRERGDTVIGPRTSQSVLSSLLYRDISAPWKRLKPSWIGEIHLLSVVDDRRCKRRHWHTHDRSFSSVVILGLSGMANVEGQRRGPATRDVRIATRRVGWRPFAGPDSSIRISGTPAGLSHASRAWPLPDVIAVSVWIVVMSGWEGVYEGSGVIGGRW